MTHDQIREMVRRVNPVPDPKALEDVVSSVPVTRQERRMDMQTDDRVVMENGGPNRGRGPLIGIAAGLVVLVGGAVFLLANDDPPVATPAPNAVPTADMEFELMDPGAYFADADADPSTTLRGTFVIESEGWDGMAPGAAKFANDGTASLMVAEVSQVWSHVCGGGGTPQPAGTSAESLANQFAAAGFTVREAVSPVTAFGQSGYHLLIELPPGCVAGNSHEVWVGPNWGERYYQAEGQMVEYWFLDVEGTPVMVEASVAAVTSDQDVAELQAILDTLVITP